MLKVKPISYTNCQLHKECDETVYWLELLVATDLLNENEFTSIDDPSSELLKMIRSAILTTRQKMGKHVKIRCKKITT